MDIAALRDRIPNANAAELELVARYAMLPEDPRRERAFTAFSETGLPHRRLEAWKWSDFKAGLATLEAPATGAAANPFAEGDDAPTIVFAAGRATVSSALPNGVTIREAAAPEAFGAAEQMPLGALTAALAGSSEAPAVLLVEVTEKVDTPLRLVFASDRAEANFSRIYLIVRKGATVELVESHLGGAGLSSHLFEARVEAGGQLTRTFYQTGDGDESQVLTSDIRLNEGAKYQQSALALGAKLCRIETQLTHQETASEAQMDAAYLAGPSRHVDFTSLVRHGATACVTRQLTKGAVRDGGRGVFQGKFHVPRYVGQKTDADMQHHALLLENGAEVNAKPELEIYADDVECAHGNTSGALDAAQLFYMRQRGIPEVQARALLTEAFIAEALESAPEDLQDAMLEAARNWLAD